MGEIKSTLDLVMERTKHLSMTDSEKEQQKTASRRQYLQGLIQKFEDQAMTFNQVAKALMQYESEDSGDVISSLKSELLSRIHLTADNNALFTLLENICHVDTAKIQKILSAFQTSLEQLNTSQTAAALETLATANRISGSAVVPNLPRDETWQAKHRELVVSYESKMADCLTDR